MYFYEYLREMLIQFDAFLKSLERAPPDVDDALPANTPEARARPHQPHPVAAWGLSNIRATGLRVSALAESHCIVLVHSL